MPSRILINPNRTFLKKEIKTKIISRKLIYFAIFSLFLLIISIIIFLSNENQKDTEVIYSSPKNINTNTKSIQETQEKDFPDLILLGFIISIVIFIYALRRDISKLAIVLTFAPFFYFYVLKPILKFIISSKKNSKVTHIGFI